MDIITTQAIIDYLLGKLSEEEELKFIEKVFGTQESTKNFEVVRENLMESYLKGKLSTDDKLKFETYFLSDPYHQELFRFSKRLREHLNDTFPQFKEINQKKPLFDFAWMIPITALGAVVIAGGLVWIILSNNNENIATVSTPTPTPEVVIAPTQTSEVTNIQNNYNISVAGNDNSSNDNQKGNLNQGNIPLQNKDIQRTPKLTPNVPQNRVVVFALAFASKGGDEKPLIISKKTEVVELRTFHPSKEFQSYVGRIKNKNGEQIWEENFTKFQSTGKGSQIKIFVPANIFESGEHTFQFEGKSADGTGKQLPVLRFTVEKEN